MQENNPYFGWILQENPNFWEDNGYKKVNSSNFHYYGCNVAKACNFPVYRKHLYICYDMEEDSMVEVFPCGIGSICHDSLAEPDKVRLGYIVNESMWPFPTNVPSIRKEMDPMRFVATRLWAMRGSADRKTLDNQLPENNGQLPENNKVSNKQPVQLELW